MAKCLDEEDSMNNTNNIINNNVILDKNDNKYNKKLDINDIK